MEGNPSVHVVGQVRSLEPNGAIVKIKLRIIEFIFGKQSKPVGQIDSPSPNHIQTWDHRCF